MGDPLTARELNRAVLARQLLLRRETCRVADAVRRVDGGIEATAFHPLAADVREGLAAGAAGLRALLADREPAVYRRHDRWWDGLPAAEVRVPGG